MTDPTILALLQRIEADIAVIKAALGIGSGPGLGPSRPDPEPPTRPSYALIVGRYVSEPDAARLSGRTVSTLRRWRAEGKGPPAHRGPGGRWLYDLAALEEWLSFDEG